MRVKGWNSEVVRRDPSGGEQCLYKYMELYEFNTDHRNCLYKVEHRWPILILNAGEKDGEYRFEI